MKRTEFYVGLLAFGVLSVSCEDRIDVDLNAASPRVVIEADLDDLYTHLPKPPEGDQNPPSGGLLPPGDESGGSNDPRKDQFIYVSRSVAFNATGHREDVINATVEVEDVETGKKYPFEYIGKDDERTKYGDFRWDQIPYRSTTFMPTPGRTYTLRVWVDGQLYASTETMPAYIEVDTIKVERDEMFGDYDYYGLFEFRDPPGQANYYRYTAYHGYTPTTSFGDRRMFSDKFNDGRQVTHRFPINSWTTSTSDENGKQVITSQVKRQVISPTVYQYWREARAINPAATAPANPKSNISNGALGYFSVSSARVYQVDLTEVYRPWWE